MGPACLLMTWITEAPMGYIIMVVAVLLEPHAEKTGGNDEAQHNVIAVSARGTDDAQGNPFMQVPFFDGHTQENHP